MACHVDLEIENAFGRLALLVNRSSELLITIPESLSPGIPTNAALPCGDNVAIVLRHYHGTWTHTIYAGIPARSCSTLLLGLYALGRCVHIIRKQKHK